MRVKSQFTQTLAPTQLPTSLPNYKSNYKLQQFNKSKQKKPIKYNLLMKHDVFKNSFFYLFYPYDYNNVCKL